MAPETWGIVMTMGFYDTAEGVDEYLALAEGFDGRELIEHLRTLVPAGARVLELGMGPGKDLDLLAETFDAIGSDLSQEFIDRYRAHHRDAELLLLDAVTIETSLTFDVIYSNKVLQHLTRDDLAISLRRQADLLVPGGLALHGLWAGEGEENHAGLLFVHYTRETFTPLIPDTLTLVDGVSYEEMEPEDSLMVVLKRNP